MARAGERGFTLVELMVVVVILGLLVGIVGPNIFRSSDDARQEIVTTQLHELAQAVSTYKLMAKRLPATLEELTTTDERHPHPYLTHVPEDPWGNAYDYRPQGRDAFQVSSPGRDGTPGTADDLVYDSRGVRPR